MQRRIYTQGELYDHLRGLPLDVRSQSMLAKYDDGIYVETILEVDCSYGIPLEGHSNRQLVIAFGMLKEGLSVVEVIKRIRTEY